MLRLADSSEAIRRKGTASQQVLPFKPARGVTVELPSTRPSTTDGNQLIQWVGDSKDIAWHVRLAVFLLLLLVLLLVLVRSLSCMRVSRFLVIIGTCVRSFLTKGIRVCIRVSPLIQINLLMFVTKPSRILMG